jgi:hypothetical protein
LTTIYLLAFGADGADGADGAGGWFCLALGPHDDPRAFHWTWIEHARNAVAADLATFWLSWLSGRLAV